MPIAVYFLGTCVRLRAGLLPHRKLAAMSNPNVYLRDDGIVRIDYRGHDRITLDVVRNAYKQHHQLSKDRKPVLIFGQSVLSMDPDAVEFASGKKVQGVTKAAAILAKSYLEEHLGNIYLSYRNLPFPMRLFSSERTALRWLEKHLH